jgi:hypothetical protein
MPLAVNHQGQFRDALRQIELSVLMNLGERQALPSSVAIMNDTPCWTIAIGIGAGSDLRKPLGIAVVGDAFLRSYALKRLKLKRVNRMPND